MNIFDFSSHLYEYAMRFFRTMAERTSQVGVATIYRQMANDCESLLVTCNTLKKHSGYGQQNDPAALCQADIEIQSLLKEDEALTVNGDIEAYAYLTRIAMRITELERSLMPQPLDADLNASVGRLLAEQRHETEILSQAWDFVSAPQHFLAWGEFSNTDEFGNFGRQQA